MALNNIAIIGAGTMGGGIAIGCMAAGLSTCVIDLNKDSLATVQARSAKFFNRMVEKEKITQEQADDAQRKLMVSNELSAVSQADLVIEAIFENLEIKRDLFTRITPDLRSEAIVATNTSAPIVHCFGRTSTDQYSYAAMSVSGPLNFKNVGL